MNYNKAEYEKSFGTAEQLGVSDLPEYCFSGRSNVGKSSLINKIVNRKALARVSASPVWWTFRVTDMLKFRLESVHAGLT